jgi:hypothetical protein
LKGQHVKKVTKAIVIISLLSGAVLLANAEYQHFHRKAMERRLIDIALNHPEVIAFREEYPYMAFILDEEPTISESGDQWLVYWEANMFPTPRLLVHVDKSTEQVEKVEYWFY